MVGLVPIGAYACGWSRTVSVVGFSEDGADGPVPRRPAEHRHRVPKLPKCDKTQAACWRVKRIRIQFLFLRDTRSASRVATPTRNGLDGNGHTLAWRAAGAKPPIHKESRDKV